MGLIQKFVVSIIIFQLAFGIELARHAQAFLPYESAEVGRGEQIDDADLRRATQLFEDEAEALASGDTAHARTHVADPFHLTRQSLEIIHTTPGSTTPAQTFSLSQPDLNLPTVTVADFKTEIQIQASPETGLAFLFSRGGKLIARHRILGVKPLTVARDQELLVFLDQNGKLYAIDMGYARTAIMKGPLPVVALVDSQIPTHLRAEAKAEFLTRGTEPFLATTTRIERAIMPIDRSIGGTGDGTGGGALTAGDFILTAPAASFAGTTELLGVFDRNVIKTQLFTAEAVLSMLAFRVAPRPESEAVFGAIAKLQEDAAVAEQTAEQQTNPALTQDPAVRNAFSALNAEAISRLLVRAQANAMDRKRPRDRILIDELQEGVRKLTLVEQLGLNYAPKPEKTVGFNIMPSVRLALKPQTLKLLAQIAAGTGAAYGADAASGGHIVHALMAIFDSAAPEVLKDSTYRITLLKSSLALGAFIPLLYGIGKFVASKANEGWSAQKALAVISFRTYAAIQLPFWYRIADLAKTPNFIRALKAGVNPLRSVETPRGRLRIGLARNAEDVAASAKALSAIAEEKARLRSLAWTLALAVAGKNAGVDPATLGVLLSSDTGPDTLPGAPALASDPVFQKEWSELAGELYYRLAHLRRSDASQDLANLSPEELTAYYGEAVLLATKIAKRSDLSSFLATMNLKWKRAGSNFLANVVGFGVEEYHFLKSATPNDFVTSQFWKQFTVDYGLAIAQMGLIGDRAKLSDPSALAASPNHIAWTTPGHFTDMVDQVRIYGIDVPARMALVYQKQRELTESAYDPIEDTELKGTAKSEGLLHGLLEWGKGAGNVVKADYSGIFLKGLLRKFRTIQVGILLGIGARLTFGHQAFDVAIPAFFYTFIWSTWQYGWLWEPVNRGNQIYGERLAEIAARLTAAKRSLGQGLRLGDDDLLKQGRSELLALYRESAQGLPNNLHRGITELEGLVSDSPERVDETIQNLERVNARALLEHAMTDAPIATEANPKVEWLTTMFGAVTTTWWATSMSVLTFRTDVAWSEKLLEATGMSALLYGGVYVGQKAIEKLTAKLAARRAAQAAISGECGQNLE